MVVKLEKMDYDATAQAAVQFALSFDERLKPKELNMRWHEQKLYEVILTRSAMMDDGVYRYLYSNKIPTKLLPHSSKLVAYFEEKNEAKAVRDLVNERMKFQRNKSDWHELVTVQPGPDNHRYRGTIG